jgi:PAS domain S-box-containing protein
MVPINILIVDDREENIVALEALLSRDDISIFSATSSNEALKIAWENNISIALIDMQMPGTDGFELVEILKSNPRTNDILVIFVTALSKQVKHTIKGIGAGAVDYLYKPLDPAITIAKVDSFIRFARYHHEINKKNQELQNLSVVIKNAADIICVIDPKSYLVQVINPHIEKVLGYKPDDIIGQSFIELLPDDQKTVFKTRLEAIVKKRIGFSVVESQFYALSEKVIWGECRISYFNGAVFINISDISQRKNQSGNSTKSRAETGYGKKVKETFLANMSHELRTPVNGIIGLTHILRKTDLTEQQKGIINLLEVSSQSLLGVINDVLDISKIESGKFRIVRSANNLNELVRSVYDLLKFKADENGIDFLLEIAPDVPCNLMVDSLRLKQILMNLLSNSIKFTERGYVKLSILPVDKAKGKVKLKISVEDSGIGIAGDKLSTIFDSFEQAEEDTASKYGGTGLGLTIVKKLVELKGGELKVTSVVGKGTLFSFVNWYTLAEKPGETVGKKPDTALEPFQNIKVLVAEDNLINQFMLSKILKDWNIEVEMVDNGRKAIEKLRGKNYDLILMDTHMPEMNGYETAKVIRFEFDEPQRSVPIISLSAAAFDYEQQEAIV